MARKKNTELKLSTIKQKAKQTHEMETYTFEDETTLKFYPEFPPTLVEEMLEEMSMVLTSENEKSGDKLSISEKLIHKYTLFLAIKHFTHLKSQFKATTLVGQINEMESLIDSGYFELIINEVFLQSEIHKLFDHMNKLGSNVMFLEKLTHKMHDEVAKLELKNQDVFNNLNFHKENNVVQ